MHKEILFLLKRNYSYGNSNTSKSGLLNSARITAEQLIKHFDVKARIEICVDGNEVDKYLAYWKPDICVLEALWVTPAKLAEVQKLHKKVNFVVRIHSEIPFLANEGIAIDWIKQYYLIPNVIVSFNAFGTFNDFENTFGGVNAYLPNIYHDVKTHVNEVEYDPGDLHIGCFGAIRPLKNQLIQAFAAIQYGYHNNYSINFHINATRQEQGGDSVLKNLRSLFKNSAHHLVEHPWLERESFLNLIKQMHLGLQVSFSESFNIVSADFTKQGVPIIVSPAVGWMPSLAKAEVDNTKSIVRKIDTAMNFRRRLVLSSQRALNKYNRNALKAWKEFLYL